MKQQGQVAIIVLVISAIALTAGLSFSKKTVQETKIDTDEEALKQAFNNAESGIDYYLNTGEVAYLAPENKGTASVTASEVGRGTVIDYGEYTLAGKAAFFWLVNHNEDGSLGSDYFSGNQVSICVPGTFNGSMLVNYFYQDSLGNYGVKRYLADLGGGLGAVLPNGSCDAKGALVGTEPEKSLLLTVTPIFSGVKVSIKADADFPSQGKEIVALGQTGEMGSGGVARRVRVLKRYQLPDFMLEAITASVSIGGN